MGMLSTSRKLELPAGMVAHCAHGPIVNSLQEENLGDEASFDDLSSLRPACFDPGRMCVASPVLQLFLSVHEDRR